jgi:hypothetical protein
MLVALVGWELAFAAGAFPAPAVMAKGSGFNSNRETVTASIGRLPTSYVSSTPIPLNYHGGRVQLNPHAYLVFWGSIWNDNVTKDAGGVYTHYQTRQLMETFFSGLGGTSYTNILTQYTDGSLTHITNPATITQLPQDAWTDTTNPPTQVDVSDYNTETQRAKTRFGFNYYGVYMIFTPSGVIWSQGGNTQICGYHQANGPTDAVWAAVGYTNGNAQHVSCGEQDVNPAGSPSGDAFGDGHYDGWTMTAYHEYIEAVTDPYGSTGWADNNYDEIGDKCADTDARQKGVNYLVPLGNARVNGRLVAVQTAFSNADSGCPFAQDSWNSFYTLDGYGGIHAGSASPALAASAYWPGWDIARGLTMTPDGNAGIVLDGWGGLHAAGRMAIPSNGPYWPNWDIARAVALAPWATPNQPDGYVLDGYGGLHQFGNAPYMPAANYFSGTDVARSLVISTDSYLNGSSTQDGGYYMTGQGIVVQAGSAVPTYNYPSWTFDIGRSMVDLPWSPMANAGGYILDGYGGIHYWGRVTTYPGGGNYTPGTDISRGLTSQTVFDRSPYSGLTHASAGDGYAVDGYNNLYGYGTPVPISLAPIYGSDIIRSSCAAGSGSGAEHH